MQWRFVVRSSFISLAIALGQIAALPAYSQQDPNISMVTLRVQQSSNGSQSVITPKGLLVALPGPGVNGSALDLYMGANGGYWYVDKHGQTQDITSYVQQIRAQSAQMQTTTPPQYAPAPYPTTNESSSSGLGTAATAATAAGVGALVGAGMAHYNNVPYGTPMYYGSNGNPYYRNVEGKDVFVNDGEVQWDNVNKAQAAKQQKQTQKVNQAKSYQEQRTSQQQAEQQQMKSAMQSNQNGHRGHNQQEAQSFQHQQQWYQDQRKDKGKAEKWQKQSAGENPFVSAKSERGGSRSGGRRESSRGDRGDRGSRGGGGHASRGGGRRSR
jgi:hypothetical protein